MQDSRYLHCAIRGGRFRMAFSLALGIRDKWCDSELELKGSI